MKKRGLKKRVKDSRSGRGHTLIELLIGMVILAFAILSLIQLFSNLSVQRVHASYRNNATLLAQELTEEIMSKKFDENGEKDINGNWSNIGIDTGETSGDKSTYDDVDDFNGWSETMGSPFSGFTRTVDVIYVAPGSLDASSTIDNSYKRVNVKVFNGGVEYANVVTIICPINEAFT